MYCPTVSDVLICDNVHKAFGKAIVDFLNEYDSKYYFEIVNDDYTLYDSSVIY